MIINEWKKSIIVYDHSELIYDHELEKDFRYRFFAHQFRYRGVGSLDFTYTDPTDEQIKTKDINVSSIGTRLRWAPNEHYIEINNERVPIHSKNPIFELEVEKAIPDVLSGDVSFTKAKAVPQDHPKATVPRLVTPIWDIRPAFEWGLVALPARNILASTLSALWRGTEP